MPGSPQNEGAVDDRRRTGRLGRSLLPLLLPFVFGVTLAAYSAQQSPDSSPKPTARQGSSTGVQGKQSFQSHCASCHGLDGHGGEHAPAIATPQVAGRLADSALFQIIHGGIPAKGMPSFDALSASEIQAIIAYLRLLTGKGTMESGKGNSARGEQLFFGKARCGDCHMVAGKGGFMGSDLTGFAGSHSEAQLRQAILHPDQWIAPAQNPVTVTTLGGDRVTGQVRNEDNFSLQLQDSDGVFHLFLKSQIAKVVREPHSLMPGDYGTRLTPAELDDLMSFLFSKGGGSVPSRSR